MVAALIFYPLITFIVGVVYGTVKAEGGEK